MIRSTLLSSAFLAFATGSAIAMCGSNPPAQGGATTKQTEKHQCMPMKDDAGMGMNAAGKSGTATDPHAGMDVSPGQRWRHANGLRMLQRGDEVR